MIRKCPECSSKNRIPTTHLADSGRCGKCGHKLQALSEPLPIQSAEQFDNLIAESKVPVLVDFWADWCGPCKMVAPELRKLAAEQSGQVIVAKVDTEQHGNLAARYSIRSIPTFIVFRKGSEDRRTQGAMSATQLKQAAGL